MGERDIAAFRMPQVEEPTPSGPLYHKGRTVGSAAAVLDFSKMMDLILSNRAFFASLPANVQKSLAKLHRMSSNAFKFASDREAYFAGQGRPALGDLKKYIENVIGIKGLPESVRNALEGVQTAIKREMSGEPAPQPKAAPAQPAPDEVGKPQESAPTSEKPAPTGRATDMKVPSGRGDPYEKLQAMFKKSRHYADIYPALPFEIRQELQRVGLDLESLKGFAKQASLGIVSRYLASRR